MHCPYCSEEDTKVIDSRMVTDGRQVRRRRECIKCNERFTTYETAELMMPMIVKRDGRRKPFSEENLRLGMLKALEKRPVSIEQVEATIGRIKHKLQASGTREIQSQILGEVVMKELRALDEVAYIRFASVYRCFQDLSDFNVEITNMEKETERKNVE